MDDETGILERIRARFPQEDARVRRILDRLMRDADD